MINEKLYRPHDIKSTILPSFYPCANIFGRLLTGGLMFSVGAKKHTIFSEVIRQIIKLKISYKT